MKVTNQIKKTTNYLLEHHLTTCAFIYVTFWALLGAVIDLVLLGFIFGLTTFLILIIASIKTDLEYLTKLSE